MCVASGVTDIADGLFLDFVEQITAIAEELPVPLVNGVPTPIVPRAEQLAVMFLLLTSNK